MRFRLIPRDNGFYPLFERQAATAVDTAVQLEKLMASLPVVSDRVDTIVAAERAGDEVMRLVRTRLETSIVTPFDREDIQSLAVPVLRHRIVVNFSAESDGITSDKVIERLIQETPAKEGELQKDPRLARIFAA